jgi:hypothetical protein
VLEVEIEWPEPAAVAGIMAPVMLLAAANANPQQPGR